MPGATAETAAFPERSPSAIRGDRRAGSGEYSILRPQQQSTRDLALERRDEATDLGEGWYDAQLHTATVHCQCRSV